ncbi:Uncharacterised protein [Mycobacteroides abscessus]|nr:Uncharacterised protein [Mycobacteroides abscessus]
MRRRIDDALGGRHGSHHLHLGYDRPTQGRGGNTAQCHPTVRLLADWGAAGAGPGVDAVPLIFLRFLGVGDLGRAAARRKAGRGARNDRPLVAGLSPATRTRAGHGVDANTVGGVDVAGRWSGCGDSGHRRRALFTGIGRQVGAGTNYGQCLRPHRDHDVVVRQRAAGARSGRAADRLANGLGRVLRTG